MDSGRRCRGRTPPGGLLAGLLCFLTFAADHGGTCRARLQQQDHLRVESYTYPSFNDGDSATLEKLRDADMYKGALQLTPDSRNPSLQLANKSGAFLLKQPFTLWRRDGRSPSAASNGTDRGVRVASFNSTFSMNVFYDSALPGEGLAFVVAPSLDGPPPGSEGGNLGLTNAALEANKTSNRFVAIEFDTVKQVYDPDDNHVGLDIGSVVSNKTASLAGFNITVATNSSTATNYTVWVQYDGGRRYVWVFMAVRGQPKPTTPVLDAPLDLSQHVQEESYLGFSASTGATYELNCILEWNLTIETFPKEDENKGWVVPVAIVGAVVAVAVVVGVVLMLRRARARKWLPQRQLEHKLSNLPGMPREFTYETLKKATKNFDERLRLGKGGYGTVYKGMLPAEDGRPEALQVAVKRFTRDDARGVNDFVAEVDIINRLRHKNIVPLVGWCYKKEQLLLVYEYMPNGSLDHHLFRRGVHEQRPVLTWESRCNVVADVASGLHYVHHEYGRMVLHRDIKASNVMLDASFRARLGDFGLARVVEFDKNSFTDLGVAGTRGYIAPEYSVGHKATRQTDVFAFGALVLEVVTGKCALLGDPRCPLLSDWVWRLHGRGALLGAVDENLGNGEFDVDEATRLLLLGLACSNPNPSDRPTMPQVSQIVSKTAPPPDVPPVKPAFVWPPEGGVEFELDDIGFTTSSGSWIGNATSTHETHGSSYSYGSLQVNMGPDSAHNLPVLSSGR